MVPSAGVYGYRGSAQKSRLEPTEFGLIQCHVQRLARRAISASAEFVLLQDALSGDDREACKRLMTGDKNSEINPRCVMSDSHRRRDETRRRRRVGVGGVKWA